MDIRYEKEKYQFNDNLKFNYHTHTYRSGHSDYMSDEEMLLEAKNAGFTSLGFSEHIPFTSYEIPQEGIQMLPSEVDDYLTSINKLKNKYQDMTILSGFEVEYDPMKEQFLGQMRSKVDYMILGQHFIKNSLENILQTDNPNYPIAYANMVVKALESGLFDIVAHPDIFMKYRDTVVGEENKQLFLENSLLASQIICEKASEMGIPLEINLGGVEKNDILSDGKLSYPHSSFWKVASEIEGLKVLYGVDAHHLKSFKNVNEKIEKASNIAELVKNKIIKDDYNPIVAREKNEKLQEALINGQQKALTYETNVVNGLLKKVSNNMPDNLNEELIASEMITSLESLGKQYESYALTENKNRMANITEKSVRPYIERKKLAIVDTKNALSNEETLIANTKESIINAIDNGCKTKEEITNTVTQITEYNTTMNEEHKREIESRLNVPLNYQGETRTLKKDDNKSGYVNVIIILIAISFLIIGVAFISWKVVS